MKQSSNNDNASRSEGDVNTSRHRKAWLEDHIDGSTRELLARDEKVFIRQSLSTPCLNALESVDGIYLVDLQDEPLSFP